MLKSQEMYMVTFLDQDNSFVRFYHDLVNFGLFVVKPSFEN